MTTNVNRFISNTMRKTSSLMSAALQQLAPYSAQNPYLEGAFAPGAGESDSTHLTVQGSIPKELDGLLLRMGPNPLQVDNPGIYHWFMGDGMVHGLRLKDGQAKWYKSRYVGVNDVNKALKRPIAPGERRGMSDTVNTNIISHAGKLWALVEAGAYLVALDKDLNTQFHGLFNSEADLPFTAHPHVDPDTGELHAICYDAGQLNKVFYINIDVNGQLKKQLSIAVQHGPMMHDCAMSKNNMLILDLPITFSASLLLKGSQLPYGWNPKHQARVGILPKTGTANDIRWFEVEPCFIFHSCNAYDLENGDVVMDAAVHDRAFDSTIQGPFEGQAIRFERWTFIHATGEVKRQVISDIAQDFPRMNERLAGKPYRYAYSISLEGEKAINYSNARHNRLLKHDLHTGQTLQHAFSEGYISGEVIFISKPAATREDEGWLVSYVHALDNSPSWVVILDAEHIEQPPQAVIELPVRVPMGFHTHWASS